MFSAVTLSGFVGGDILTFLACSAGGEVQYAMTQQGLEEIDGNTP